MKQKRVGNIRVKWHGYDREYRSWDSTLKSEYTQFVVYGNPSCWRVELQYSGFVSTHKHFSDAWHFANAHNQLLQAAERNALQKPKRGG